RAGDIYTVAGNGRNRDAGDGGPARRAALQTPSAISLDAAGNVVIGDTGSLRIRVLAERSDRFYGRGMRAGDIYLIGGDGRLKYGGDGGIATHAQLSLFRYADGSGWHGGVAEDGSGNLYVADLANRLVRFVPAVSGSFYGREMTAGHIYTIAGDDLNGGPPADGSPALAAHLFRPTAVTVGPHGSVLISDGAAVRLVAAVSGQMFGRAVQAGDIYTVAGGGTGGLGLGGPATKANLVLTAGIAVDGAGNLIVAARGINRILTVADRSGVFNGHPMIAGHLYLLAGTGYQTGLTEGVPAAKAALDTPEDVTVDSSGNLVIADTVSNRIAVVARRSGTFYGQAMTAGYIYTVAGAGPYAPGTGHPAVDSWLSLPGGVAADRQGLVIMAGCQVFLVPASSGALFGQQMTAGDMYTLAGGATSCGFGGDGGPGPLALLYSPGSVATDQRGDVTVGDGLRVRTISR
ncbi:MAG TPA: hypothetical protein VF834_19315, partial [Streptosporangiaceae bacterium]